MGYQLLDANGSTIVNKDLQNKGFWCQHGLSKEQIFVATFGEKFGVILNPDKEKDPYVPDLFQTYDRRLADLKTQNTPLFQAQQRYNINPQYAVTFNLKDYERYMNIYGGNVAIYFCVEWIPTTFVSSSGQRISVKSMKGVWWTDMFRLQDLVKTAPVHSYQQRVHDTKGNAKASYVFDLTSSAFTRLVYNGL
ncbi:hypothetical protein RBG13_002467 [Vibrio cholerae]|nr:hypothetical protein [Vibrio cholerae]